MAPPEDHRTLFSIPFDVQVKILIHLSPLDIISVRKTCQPLYHSSHARPVWREVVERVLQENNLFHGGFDLESMTTTELERVATSPSRSLRVLSTLTKPTGDRMAPFFRQRQLSSLASGELMAREDGNPQHIVLPCIYLVPGGRFLFVMTHKRMALFDLARLPDDPVACVGTEEPLATCAVDGFKGIFTIHPSANGKMIRIVNRLVCTDAHSKDRGTEYAIVHEIDPTASRPQFTPLTPPLFRTTTRDESMDYYCLLDDLFIFVQSHTIRIWDIIKNSWTWWSFDRLINPEDLVISSARLMLLHSRGVFIWDIPSAHRTDLPAFQEDAPYLPPIFRLDQPQDPTLTASSRPSSGMCSWYSGKDSIPFLWDKTQWKNSHSRGKHLQVSRFELVLSDSPDSSSHNTGAFGTQTPVPGAVEGVLHETVLSAPPISHQGRLVGNHRLCNETVVSLWLDCDPIDPYRVYVSLDRITSRSTQKQEGRETGGREELEGEATDRRYMPPAIFTLHAVNTLGGSFCPFSCRLAHITKDEKVLITDFIN